MNNIDLNDIRLFVTVVQAGSLTKAANLLNMPKSYLSRHLTRLEQDLGTTLMDRSRQGILLNELGERFYLKAQDMLQTVQTALDSVRSNLEAPHGLLKMSVSTEVGRGFLMFHLAEYMRRYPDVSLEIQIDNHKINLIREGVDIALRLGDPNNNNVVARKLFDIELGLFASKAYLAKAGIPQTPHELHGHDLLYKYDGPDWHFSYKQRSVHIEGKNKLYSNDFNLIGHMVGEDMGIAMLPCFNNMIRPDWVRLLPEWKIAKVPLYAVYYKNRGSVLTVQSMVEFLLQKNPALQS